LVANHAKSSKPNACDNILPRQQLKPGDGFTSKTLNSRMFTTPARKDFNSAAQRAG